MNRVKVYDPALAAMPVSSRSIQFETDALIECRLPDDFSREVLAFALLCHLAP
jgi:hypothetical protein